MSVILEALLRFMQVTALFGQLRLSCGDSLGGERKVSIRSRRNIFTYLMDYG